MVHCSPKWSNEIHPKGHHPGRVQTGRPDCGVDREYQTELGDPGNRNAAIRRAFQRGTCRHIASVRVDGIPSPTPSPQGHFVLAEERIPRRPIVPYRCPVKPSLRISLFLLVFVRHLTRHLLGACEEHHSHRDACRMTATINIRSPTAKLPLRATPGDKVPNKMRGMTISGRKTLVFR